MIIRARTVVTMDGPPFENGAVAISGNQIVDVGKFDDIKKRNTGDIVDLGERALLPGLINAHCHLDYTCLRGKITPPKSFADWVRAINAEKAKLTADDYIASITEGFAEAKRFGTTTVANLTAVPGLISQVRPPIRSWWFAELIDVRSAMAAGQNLTALGSQVSQLVDRAVAQMQPAEHWGLAPHALFTASRNLYRRCEEIARQKSILLTTHLAESREEMEMFRNGSGPLYEFLKSIGRSMDDCGNRTPLGLFLDAIGDRALPPWIVAHLNELTESDFDLLQTSKSRFHIVHSPRSHGYFGHSRFPFERLRALRFNISLGTDSLASNENLSLFAEMRAFQRHELGISPDKVLEMVTVNAARALDQENALGRIRPGFRADLISIPISASPNLFDEIVAFDRPIDWMMVNGMQMTKSE